MKSQNPFKKNPKFNIGMVLTVVEGLMASTVNFAVFMLAMWILDGSLNEEKIKSLFFVVLGCFVVRFILYGFGYTCGQIGGAQISKNLRLTLGDKMKKIPLKSFAEGQTGTYINILTDNVAKYEKILTHKTPNLVKNGAISVMLIAFAFYLYVPAGIILLVAALLFLPEMKISFKIGEKYGGARVKIYNKAVSSMVEYISGIQTLRAYGLCGVKNKDLTGNLKDFSNINYKYEAKGIPVSFIFNNLQWLSLPAVMCISAKAWETGALSDGYFLMLCMIPILLVKLLMAISVDVFSYKDMHISKAYIENLLAEKEEVTNDKTFIPSYYTIEFKNVDFAYEKAAPVLNDVNLKLPASSLIAIVGDSGSGKSTIMNLIGKYYDADKGEILIGEKNIKDFPSSDVLSVISLVDQNVFLFDDSVLDNIRYARPDATDEEIVAACKKANCHDFIMNMKDGYKTKIGENGSKLSGGERQRLSIARAILRDKPVILLDEATASLDIENELLVRQAIRNLLKEGKTIVMIAHTLPVIRNADMIVVVDNKTIAEYGSHDELIRKQGKYFRMFTA